MHLAILSRHLLADIPSASGIEVVGDSTYVIGDNSPWLFKLNQDFQLVEQWQLTEAPAAGGTVIPKQDKADFEAITTATWRGEKCLLIFGSGSLSPQRDTLTCIKLCQPAVAYRYTLSDFYQGLKQGAGIADNQLNIEAAAVCRGNLLLFNRGVNFIASYALDALIDYLTTSKPVPSPKIYAIDLPAIDGIQAGFSGAAATPEDDYIVFTASVENTDNWIDDGAVLGSFVGLIPFSALVTEGLVTETLVTKTRPTCIPVQENEMLLPIKIESVAVQAAAAGNLSLLLVTDSDGGHSELLTVHLRFG
jgi:hypothetical protein